MRKYKIYYAATNFETNISNRYPSFDNGNATNSFMTNPDGSLYIGAVWPGYTVFPDWLSDGAGQ